MADWRGISRGIIELRVGLGVGFSGRPKVPGCDITEPRSRDTTAELRGCAPPGTSTP